MKNDQYILCPRDGREWETMRFDEELEDVILKCTWRYKCFIVDDQKKLDVCMAF